jgi:hypothetical protein
MNAPYFQAQEGLLASLNGSSARWEPKLGYEDSRYDSCNPQSVRQALLKPCPLDAVLTELATKLLKDCDPGVVGIGIAVPSQILPALYAARALRNCGFSGSIILGGNVVTRLATKMALPWLFDLVDGLVLFQGEIALPAICDAPDRRQWASIPNLVWRDNGAIRTNPTQVLSPAQFGPPDFQGLPIQDYWGTQFLPAIGSRGCYYGRCSFCSIPYGWGNGGFLGNDTAESVVDQLQTGVTRHGIRRFKFVEEALHPGLLLRVADQLIDRGLEVEFEGYARYDQSWFAPGLLQRLSDAGLRKLYLGLELAPSQNRDLLNKADHADPAGLLTALSDHGILAHVFCMFGYPGTGIDDALTTVDFALKHESLIDTLDVFPFYFATHTNVHGVVVKEEPDRDWALEYKYEPALPGVLSMEEVAALTADLETFLWRTTPRWLHPVYRLSSPWTRATQQERRTL